MDARAIGISAALGSAASWALGSILFKQLGEHISSLAMTLAKGGVSVIFLGLALVFTGYQGLEVEPLLLLILSGLLGISAGDTFFFEALQDLGPHTLVLLLMLGQVFTVLLAVFFLGETPTVNVWQGIFLVIVGIGIVIYPKFSEGKEALRIRGIIFGLLSVVCMSVSIIIAKKPLDSISAIEASFIRMLSGTVGMLFLGIVTRRLGRWVMPFKNLRLVYLFLISVAVITFGGFWLSLVSVKYLDVSVANTLNSTEPIFVLFLAAFFLKEKITMRALLGTAITTIGIILICTS